MTDPRETLARIRAQADAASPAPWFDEERNLDEPYSLTTVYYCFHNGETPDRDLVAEVADDNAEFIAAARTTVPALLDALEKVLELHVKAQPIPAAHGTQEGGDYCAACAEDWPCPDVRAITTALEAIK